MKLYTQILRQSWRVTAKNPVLWLFGFFLLFWVGKGMEIENFFTNIDLYRSSLSPLSPEFWNAAGWSQVVSASGVGVASFLMLLLAGLILVGFLFGVMMVAQIGLADGYGKAARNRRHKSYALRDALAASKHHFLTVAVVNLFGKGASLALLTIAALPLFVADSVTGQFLYTVVLYLLVSPLVIVISMWIHFVVNDIVLNETTVDEAMQNGWLLLRHNFGVALELALLLFLVYFLVVVASQALGGLLAMPLVLAGSGLEWFIGVGTAQALFYVVYGIMSGVVLLATVSVFSSWSHGCWTLLYVELTKKKHTSKTYRLLHGKA